jgi:long-subunit acyl-CoA synthetase (AMP-forming)
MPPSIHAKTQSDKPAIVMTASSKALTFAKLGAQSNQAAQFFRSKGFQAGDTIALCMDIQKHAAPLRWTVPVTRLGPPASCSSHSTARTRSPRSIKHRITDSSWVRIHFVRTLKLPDEVRFRLDVSSLRSALHAAGRFRSSARSKHSYSMLG